ncbi:MATE family efflux transporter [Candidatus Cloacimonadota bacterium]
MDQPGNDLTKGSIYRNLIKLSLPIMLSNFLQMFYNLTDTFWLGKLGDDARNAVSVAGLAFPLVFFISSFGFGFVVAGTALISQYKGAGQLENAKKVVGQFIIILIIFSVCFLSVSFIFMDQILILLKTPDIIMASAKSYITYILSGLIFMFIFLSYQSFSHGLGDTVSPMKIQLISVAINVALDPVLIFGLGGFPRLGVTGAGIATLIARIVASIIAVYVFLKKTPILRPTLIDLHPDRSLINKILKISIPASLSQSVTSFGFLILQGFINTFGTLVISTFSIGNRITGFFMMPAMGMSNALSAIVGQNLGAKKIDRAVKSIKAAFVTIMLIMLVSCTATFFFGAELTRLFINDPAVAEVGSRMFKVTSFAAFIFAIGFIFMGVFNGSGHTKLAMIFNISRLWVFRIPLVFILSGRLLTSGVMGNNFISDILHILAKPLADHPYDALWWSMLISNVLSGAAAFYLYRQGKWKKAKIYE